MSLLYHGRNSIVWYLDGHVVCGRYQCPGSILMPNQLYPEIHTLRSAKHSSEICSRIWLRMYVKDLYTLTLSLPSTSKNQYLSAKHVSRTPEYCGFMGSTQSISRTNQHIAVKLSQNVANILTFIWTNNKKIVTWPLVAILKIWKMPINNLFMQK